MTSCMASNCLTKCIQIAHNHYYPDFKHKILLNMDKSVFKELVHTLLFTISGELQSFWESIITFPPEVLLFNLVVGTLEVDAKNKRLNILIRTSNHLSSAVFKLEQATTYLD